MGCCSLYFFLLLVIRKIKAIEIYCRRLGHELPFVWCMVSSAMVYKEEKSKRGERRWYGFRNENKEKTYTYTKRNEKKKKNVEERPNKTRTKRTYSKQKKKQKRMRRESFSLDSSLSKTLERCELSSWQAVPRKRTGQQGNWLAGTDRVTERPTGTWQNLEEKLHGDTFKMEQIKLSSRNEN